MTKEELVARIASYNPNADHTMVELAYEYAATAHRGQKRLNGDDYITHCMGTVHHLLKMRMDDATIIAGLLHDVTDETAITLDDIKAEFGEEIALLVDGVSRLGKLKYRGLERYADNLRKLFVSMAHDIRIIFIKFADRLHNLETLDALPAAKQQRIAREVMDIYMPIAHRLGIWYVKSRLEDLAFQYLYPQDHSSIASLVAPELLEREEYLTLVRDTLSRVLDAHGVGIESIESRVKTYFSIYRKMEKKKISDLEGVYDLVAMRIIVRSVSDCYSALGCIHQLWKPLPGRIKDYIAQPKPNNYRSLHTTVFCTDGDIVEFQIQTPEMRVEAQYGVAAHWHYSEAKKRSEKITGGLDWVREILALQDKTVDNQEYLRSLKFDIFKKRIFVFTPKGDVINLPEEATPIDFAYYIHSDIGRRCVGARINDSLCTLSTPLRSGDVVEILTERNRKVPSVHWLSIAKTHVARVKIKAQLREHELRTGSSIS